MRTEYDFGESKSNPYARKLRKPITIRLGLDVVDYFKEMAEETGVPYQTLINLYLKDCVQHGRKLNLSWVK